MPELVANLLGLLVPFPRNFHFRKFQDSKRCNNNRIYICVLRNSIKCVLCISFNRSNCRIQVLFGNRVALKPGLVCDMNAASVT